MEFMPEGPKAIPLWINGRAFLTMAPSFFEVVNPQTGTAQYQVPLCGADEAQEAVAAARAALPGWQAMSANDRQAALAALADALANYAGHFAKLLRGDTGVDDAQAQADVAAAIAALREGEAGVGGLIGAVLDAGQPLAGFAATAAPIWRAGGCVVVKPSPKAPSAIFALCELTARAGWPGGVVNLLQGDTEAITGLCATEIDRLVYSGDAALGAQVGAIATAAGKPFTLRAA